METQPQIMIQPSYIPLPQTNYQPIIVTPQPSPMQPISQQVITMPYAIIPQIQQEEDYENENSARISVVLLIIGFFCSLIWVVNYFIFNRSRDRRASFFARLSLAMFAIGILLCSLLITLTVLF